MKIIRAYESETILREVLLPVCATGSSTSKFRGGARGPNLLRLLGTWSVEGLDGVEGSEGGKGGRQKTMFSMSTHKTPLAVGSEQRPMNSIREPRFGGGTFFHRGAALSSLHLKHEKS